jgi:8-amino-3,8-dideoxy-alpha-D-manno-octulosonate transaminase
VNPAVSESAPEVSEVPAKKIARDREKLAIDGGPPVRTTPLPGAYPGALLIGRAEEKQVLEVLRSKSLFRYYGPDVLGKVTAFEQALASKVGVAHALAVNSGTSALKCALHAVGVGPGDEVLVPAYSYVASADVVLSLGARPVFVEVDASLTLDPTDLEAKITERTRAITPVHLFGVSADMAPILEIARRRGIPVVEDAAQSLGGSYRGTPSGTLGDVGITSFQLNKVITCGEGGAVFTADEALHHRAMRLHDHGNVRGPGGASGGGAGQITVGEGFRMGELSGAVLLAQLERLETIVGKMLAAKQFLADRLAKVPGVELARVPDPAGDVGAALVFFVADAARAVRFVAALEAEGVRAMRNYGGKALYAQAAVVTAGLGQPGQCPATEALVGRSVFIGLTTTFSKKDLGDIVTAVRKVARGLGQA